MVYNNCIRRNQFDEIFRFLLAADVIRYTPVSTCMSIDESMIPYFGPNGCKQFIKGKSIRFGYKAWVWQFQKRKAQQTDETFKLNL